MEEKYLFTDKDIIRDFLIHPQYKLFRHLLLILILVTISFQNIDKDISARSVVAAFFVFLLFMAIIYFNITVLAPKFLFKNRFSLYVFFVISSILAGIILLLISLLWNPSMTESETDCLAENQFLIAFLNIVSLLIQMGLIVMSSSTILVFRRWIIHRQRINALENATMQSELEQLKNQINPHFLFNMLNNANVLTKENPEEASRILFELNDLLKYQLNDSVQDEVKLDADIQFLTDFLNLEKIRRDNFQFHISKEGNTAYIKIPPLLFIPFVENAVKHGNDNKAPSHVDLYFKVADKILYFNCVNSKPVEQEKKAMPGGLGLSNIKRRLELLYDKSFLLEIIDKTSVFEVNMQIPLQTKITNFNS